MVTQNPHSARAEFFGVLESKMLKAEKPQNVPTAIWLHAICSVGALRNPSCKEADRGLTNPLVHGLRNAVVLSERILISVA